MNIKRLTITILGALLCITTASSAQALIVHVFNPGNPYGDSDVSTDTISVVISCFDGDNEESSQLVQKLTMTGDIRQSFEIDLPETTQSVAFYIGSIPNGAITENNDEDYTIKRIGPSIGAIELGDAIELELKQTVRKDHTHGFGPMYLHESPVHFR